MYRLLGFCLGSIASVSALMFLIGWPDFHLSGDTDDTGRFDMAVQKLKAKQRSGEPTMPATVVEPEPPAANTDFEAVAIDSDIPASAVADATGPTEGPVDAIGAIEPMDAMASDSAGPATTPAEAWHTIWTPFRSRIAADGFVSRLESVTGLDYRVVQVKTGVYEVAFAYADQAELDTNLARISAATGLDLGADPP